MKNILIVDDEAINRELLLRVLQKEGYGVDEASNGAIALEMLQNKEYALICMDLDMPVMDGYEAISKIRADKENRSKIVVISANLDAKSIEKIFALGAEDYLHKPYNLQTMLKILKRQLEC